MAKDEPFYNIKGESSACERIKIMDVDDETSLAISLNEIGQFKSIKVYKEGFVDNQQKRIEELENENNKLLDVINNQDVKITDLEKQIEKDTAHRIYIFNKVIELYKALKKENAELKEQGDKWFVFETDAGNWGMDKATQYTVDRHNYFYGTKKECQKWSIEHKIKDYTGHKYCYDRLEDQLAEAKEIISNLLTRLHNFTYTGLDCEECKEAEQFIKEIGA